MPGHYVQHPFCLWEGDSWWVYHQWYKHLRIQTKELSFLFTVSFHDRTSHHKTPDDAGHWTYILYAPSQFKKFWKNFETSRSTIQLYCIPSHYTIFDCSAMQIAVHIWTAQTGNGPVNTLADAFEVRGIKTIIGLFRCCVPASLQICTGR